MSDTQQKMDPVTLMKMRGLATVIDDLLADDRARFSTRAWGDISVGWNIRALSDSKVTDSVRDEQWRTPSFYTICGLNGWSTLAPYMRKLGIPKYPNEVSEWIGGENPFLGARIQCLFHAPNLTTRRETLLSLRNHLNRISHEFGGPAELEPLGEYEDLES